MNRFLLVWILLPFAALSQEPRYAWTASLVLNENWNRPSEDSRQGPFGFFADVIIIAKSERVGNALQYYYCSRAVWLQEQSWMADSIEGTYRPLAQLYLDCYEFEARKISEDINSKRFDPGVYARMARERADSLANVIRTDTEEGADVAQLRVWREWMDNALQALPRIDTPDRKPVIIEAGIDAGLGMLFFIGDMGTYVKNTLGVGLGATIRLNRFCIDYHWLGTRTQPRQTFEQEDFKFSDTNRLGVRQSVVGIGYCVTRFPRLAVVPYAALSLLRLVNADEPKSSLYGKGPLSATIGGGVLAEWCLHPYPSDGHSEKLWKLILRAEYSHVNYLYKIPGSSFRVQFGIGCNF